jgi:hypothetical protein
MVSRLGLQGDQLIAYAIVNGFSQGGAGEYTGGRQYMSEFLGWSTHKAGRLLNELLERGLITRREVSRHGAQVVYAYSVTGSCEEQNVTRHEVQIEPRRGTKRTSHEVQNEPRHEVQNVPHNYKGRITSNNSKEKQTVSSADQISAEFAELWKKYPKKIGRQEALESYKKSRKTHSFEEIDAGIDRFVLYAKRSIKDKDYIPYGSTFFHKERWQDEFTCDSHSKWCENAPRERSF